ncbi:MAG: TonB family protein [Zoogloeaceae bacterium]|jgi:protein TonB|nr:TonB family protein [Zoogloeaceae bacterium]
MPIPSVVKTSADCRMLPAQSAQRGVLVVALVFSLGLHALPLVFALPASRASLPVQPAQPIHATLKQPEQPLPAEIPPPTPELSLDMPEEIHAPAPSPPPAPVTRVAPARLRPRIRAAATLGNLPAAAAREANRQLAQLPYPLEAIEQGLEGEVWIRIFLDENGNAIAARVEQSSGHAILDAAAQRAAAHLKSLSAEGMGDAQIPIRFRLE